MNGERKEGKPAVEFRDVFKGFGGRKVLDGVSFRVAPGEAVCILGRSGTGKSVTLKLAIGLIKADSGLVAVQGCDLGKLDADELADVRRRMGFMFQNAALFDSMNLNNNLGLPLHRLRPDKSSAEIEKAVETTLKRVGLQNEGAKMPAALSGGMQKRAGLARALVLEPEILLVDEPSSGLDRITAGEITQLLKTVKEEQKTTMLIVTHDIHGARAIADKFAVLDGGKLIGFGPPGELDKSDDKQLHQYISEDA